MEIIELEKEYYKDVEVLLEELQKYIVSIDAWELNIINDGYKEKYFSNMLEEAKENGGKIFVCKKDNKIIGMIYGYIISYDESERIDYTCPKTGKIEELIVSKDYRNDGVGNLLIKTMEDYFRISECEYCRVDVFEPNDIARKFYKKNNYVERLIELSKKLI